MLIAAGTAPIVRNDRDGRFESMSIGKILVANELARTMDSTRRLHLGSLYIAPKGRGWLAAMGPHLQ
jgi:hypothetical protein